MRQLTDIEKDIIHAIISNKQNNNLGELQIAKILRTELSFLAIKWEITPRKAIYVFAEENTPDKVIDNNYFQISDFLYFIEELENNHFIKVQSMPTIKNDYKVLYDKDIYTYNPPTIGFAYNADSNFFFKKRKQWNIFSGD
ncbi:hypothetical protein [Bacteroides sp.]|uniref:hypothetical protein n=1 Tax=Bacteroides sp. TaxID=29523 RepID=UPI003D0B2FF1